MSVIRSIELIIRASFIEVEAAASVTVATEFINHHTFVCKSYFSIQKPDNGGPLGAFSFIETSGPNKKWGGEGHDCKISELSRVHIIVHCPLAII